MANKKITKKAPAKRKPAKRTKAKTKAKRKPAKRKYTRKPKEVLVPSPVAPNLNIVVASELADDQLIEQELMGEVLPYYIYQFDDKGRTTTGLSVKGVNEVTRRLNRNRKSGYKIHINPQHQKVEHNVDQNGELGVQVSVFAENLIDGNSGWGIKFEAYYKMGKRGKYKNDFAVEKALSKAERNAKRKLIPETVVIKMIEKIISSDPKSVRQIESPAPVPTINIDPTPQPKLKPMTLPKIKQMIRDAISQAKTSGQVIEADENTQKSKKFSAAFKKEIHNLANDKVNEIDSKK